MRFRRRATDFDQELVRAKAAFDEIIANEIEQRATELERTLALARAESLSALVDEERRITEERRRDVAERERDATARLAAALADAERRVGERLAGWGADLEQLQDGLAEELARIAQRLGQLTADAEDKIADEGERLQSAVDEHRALIGRLREENERSAQQAAKEAEAEIEQYGAERRKALHEVADRLRRRERDLQEQIERELTEAMQRIASQLGDVEHRQLEQLKRVVSREATRYAEAAAQQFDVTFRTAREDAARRLSRELDLAVERFAREAEGLLSERVAHLVESSMQRIDTRIELLARRLDELEAHAPTT